MSGQRMQATMPAAIFALAVAMAGPALAQPADLILQNARIHTVDPAGRVAEAVAIRGQRIVAVGTRRRSPRRVARPPSRSISAAVPSCPA